jgi:hypothetical protein
MRTVRLVASAWLAGAAASVLLAAVLIGCCALPFHGALHRLLPCHAAQAALAGHAAGSHDSQPPAVPASRERDRETLGLDRQAQRLELRCEAPLAPRSLVPSPPPGATAGRSRLALGAMRCDDDVGLRLALLDTLRI